jgi:CarboxypepD_reg-like domain/Gram-negative bacterial TonB protein C-terminal
MSTENNIKNFTGADIEKYQKGLLSAKESHDLEKAALDDPFLADALEGYAVTAVDHAADMDDLKKRLAEKTGTEKVITMKSPGSKPFPWLRIAAMVVILAGAGLLAQQLIFKGKKNEIAQAKNKTEEIKPAESPASGTTTTITDSGSTNQEISFLIKDQKNTSIPSGPDQKVSGSKVTKDSIREDNTASGAVTVTNNATKPAVTAPVKTEDEKSNQYKIATGNTEKKDIAKEEVKSKSEISLKKDTDTDGITDKRDLAKDDRQQNKAVIASRKTAENNSYRNQANIFRGRVTDETNAGVPFANVTNLQDNNAGTYTDANGYFNLTYPDTVLTVQVRSVGFENTNVQLRNVLANNQVVLQDDKSLSEVVISNQKPNVAARSKEANKTLEEPEPADGWDNYDTYLVNNLNPPEEFSTKQKVGGVVQVSFAVDKNGEPISIKIEKSLCDKCDKEAIRLIKEGPKWRRNTSKKGRTTVTISF